MADKNQTEPQVSKYSEISRDIWLFFTKYLHTGANMTSLADDIHALDDKYLGTDEYHFMQNLLKVFFDELRRVKE